MKFRTFLSNTVALLLLTGCNSLNVNSITIHHQSAVTTQSTELEVEATPVEPAPTREPAKPAAQPLSCPVYQLPQLPPIPELPIKELEKLGPQGGAQIAELERKHIEELRIHALRTRALINKSYAQYLAACRQSKKK
jgi:hypothetical protein